MNKTQFTKDEQSARLTIERVFPAAPSRVWQAMTDPAILDQWWGPKPWWVKTIHMDFRVGGYWHYSMNGPNGEQHFGRMDYLEIEPGRRFKAKDAFTDAAGKINDSLPRQAIDTRLAADGNHTKVVTVIQYASLEDLTRIFEMGFREGLTMAHDQLETLLAEE
jgi:uncharacterized protein YndB with AHSA1/START domain